MESLSFMTKRMSSNDYRSDKKKPPNLGGPALSRQSLSVPTHMQKREHGVRDSRICMEFPVFSKIDAGWRRQRASSAVLHPAKLLASQNFLGAHRLLTGSPSRLSARSFQAAARQKLRHKSNEQRTRCFVDICRFDSCDISNFVENFYRSLIAFS